MPTVNQLAAPYENFMLSPRAGPGVCIGCLNLVDGYDWCYACLQHPRALSAIAPISYSVGHEQLHHALASYKRLSGEVAKRLTAGIAAVLWRYLVLHERCVARAAGVTSFPVITTVPSSDRCREAHPMGRIVGELVGPTRQRYQPLLVRSEIDVAHRVFSPDKFTARSSLSGEPVLLIDDTWTTGANAQSAAATLRAAGSGPVAALVVGRHVNRDWHDNDRRLRALGLPFDWTRCVLCAGVRTPVMQTPSPVVS